MKKEVSAALFGRKLAKLPVQKKEELLQFLPEKAPMPSLETLSPLDIPFSLEIVFDKIHENWMTPYLETLSPKEISFYLSSLSEEKRESLAKLLTPTSSFSFSPKMKLFVLRLLFKEIFPEESAPLPFSYLPSDPLICLIQGDYRRISKLIFYLGLYDVALEFRKVIQRDTLKKMEEVFDREELNWIRENDAARSRVHFAEIGLVHWKGDGSQLREVVYERGLNRLAKALHKAPKEILWYIEHLLTPKEAIKLRNWMQTPVEGPVFIALQQQTLETWEKVCTVFHS